MQNAPEESRRLEIQEDLFERKKTQYFSRLAMRHLSAMKLHRESGLWEENFADKRVSKHCLAVAARLEALSDLLGLSDELKHAAVSAGVLHDFHKIRELEMVQEARDRGASQWDANLHSGDEAQEILEERAIDPLVRRLLKMPGNAGVIECDRLLREEPMTDLNLAKIAVHYIDGISKEAEWVKTVEELSKGTQQRINALDVRIDAVEAKPNYAGFNEEGRKYFGGETLYQAMRRVNHAIEQRICRVVLERTGKRVDPLDLPSAIDDRLREIIAAV